MEFPLPLLQEVVKLLLHTPYSVPELPIQLLQLAAEETYRHADASQRAIPPVK